MFSRSCNTRPPLSRFGSVVMFFSKFLRKHPPSLSHLSKTTEKTPALSFFQRSRSARAAPTLPFLIIGYRDTSATRELLLEGRSVCVLKVRKPSENPVVPISLGLRKRTKAVGPCFVESREKAGRSRSVLVRKRLIVEPYRGASPIRKRPSL